MGKREAEEIREICCCWFWRWKKGVRGQGMWIALRNWKGQRNEISPGASRKKNNPANTLILAYWVPFEFQNFKRLLFAACWWCSDRSVCSSRRRSEEQGARRTEWGKWMTPSTDQLPRFRWDFYGLTLPKPHWQTLLQYIPSIFPFSLAKHLFTFHRARHIADKCCSKLRKNEQ